ncbi:MAG: hypothetical protein ABJE95_33625 [Byssovorax sp.]
MSTPHRLAALALALLSAGALAACGKSDKPTEEAAPHVPASSDPAGKDIVEGAVVAAVEKSGGVRIYKVTHVDDYPDPIGYEYHMIAYDPKCDSYEIAAKTWKNHGATPMFDHLVVREVSFLPRDHRVLFVEPLTPAELATYTKSLDGRGGPVSPSDLQPH